MADKVTMAEFEKRLSEGRYDTLTGARRGIGKMGGWSDKEKALANEKADAHFGGKKAAPKKAKSPKSAAAKAPKKAKVAAPKVARKGKAAKASAVPSMQLELPLTDELARTQVSIERSKALKGILENAVTTRDLGGPDAEIKRVAAAASKDLIDSIHTLLCTTENVKHSKESAGDNGSKVDTSTADAALAAAAAAAQKATSKGPPVIPPLMGRQG